MITLRHLAVAIAAFGSGLAIMRRANFNEEERVREAIAAASAKAWRDQSAIVKAYAEARADILAAGDSPAEIRTLEKRIQVLQFHIEALKSRREKAGQSRKHRATLLLETAKLPPPR